MDIIKVKSMALGLEVLKIKTLLQQKRELILANQILRAGTSVGANLAEAISGQSKKDFIAKMFIAYKELNETEYWLKLFRRGGLLSNEDLIDAENLTKELLKLLTASLKTARLSNP